MAIETTLRIGVTDVHRLTFEYRACGSVVSLTRERLEPQRSCPACRGVWMSDSDTTLQTAVVQLFNSLKYLLD